MVSRQLSHYVSIVSLFAFILAGSCKKETSPPEEKAFIRFDKSSIEFSDLGGRDSAVIEASQPWKITRSSSSDWLHFSKDSGSTGKTVLYFYADRQFGSTPKQATLTFSSPNLKPTTLNITQQHKVRIEWLGGYAYGESLFDINGSGFSRIPEENIVTVNGVKATVASSNNMQLKIIVPKSCGSGPIIVSVAGKSDTSKVNLQYRWTGVVEIIAGGSGLGYFDGPGANAKFNQPEGISTDKDGNIYVADYANYKVRKITPAGQVSTMPGRFAPWQNPSGPNTDYALPTAVKPGLDGKLYITEYNSHGISSFEPPSTTKILAGGGSVGFTNAVGSAAQFYNPTDLAIDATGNIYVADLNNYAIRKITPDALVTTFAGGQWGNQDGQGTSARFNRPMGITIDAAGNLYTTDYFNNNVRKITPSGLVTTIAGNSSDYSSRLYHPKAITVSPNGTLFISENDGDNLIRIIYQDKGLIETIGTFITNTGAPFSFRTIGGLWAINNNVLLVTDYYNHRICRLTYY